MLRGPIALATIRTSFVLGMRLFVQAGTLLLLASTLGPEGFGIYAAAGAMAVLLGTLASFGTHLTLLRDVSRASPDVNDALRLALGTTALCGSVLFLIYVVLSQVIFQIPESMWWVIVFLGGAEVLVQPFLVIAAMEFHGRGRIALSQILLSQPLILRLLAVLAIVGGSPVNPLFWYAFGHLIAVAVPVIYVVFMASVIWRRPHLWRLAGRSEWKGLAGYALMNASANGVAELDKMLAARLLSSSTAGIYSAASRVVGSFVVPVMAMILSAMPRLFRNESDTGRSLQYWLFVLAGIYGTLAAVVVALAAPLVESLLGPSYTGVNEFIRLLAFAAPAICVRVVATNILTTLERPWTRISLELVGWLVILTLGILFVRTQGDSGLAISIIIAEWLLAVSSVVLICRLQPLSISLPSESNRNE
jgi:O-antigen/teichoic acid export membrane protein